MTTMPLQQEMLRLVPVQERMVRVQVRVRVWVQVQVQVQVRALALAPTVWTVMKMGTVRRNPCGPPSLPAPSPCWEDQGCPWSRVTMHSPASTAGGMACRLRLD